MKKTNLTILAALTLLLSSCFSTGVARVRGQVTDTSCEDVFQFQGCKHQKMKRR